MSSSAPGAAALPFEIKSAQLPLMAFLLKTVQVAKVAQELQHRYGDSPDFFDQEPLLIDVSALQNSPDPLDFPALVALLRQYRLQPIAIKGGNPTQLDAARAAGLVWADDTGWTQNPVSSAASTPAPAPATNPAAEAQPALLVDRPLRSGQQVYARGRDLIVTAMVNPGAEVIADGNIHVYAPLRGKAIAGARGNGQARIFAQALEAELISIAGVYRTSDVPLPDNVRGKPAQVWLQSSEQGDKLLIEPIL